MEKQPCKTNKQNAALCCGGMDRMILLLPVMDRAAPFESMTYSQKLRTPEWREFRERVFAHYPRVCFDCANDPEDTEKMEVHHRRYFWGREPWEYEMEDVRIVCRACHDEIHKCEDAWRNIIRALPPWVVSEVQRLADEMQDMEVYAVHTWATACRGVAREIKRKGQYDGR
jgi:hypothetical protein